MLTTVTAVADKKTGHSGQQNTVCATQARRVLPPLPVRNVSASSVSTTSTGSRQQSTQDSTPAHTSQVVQRHHNTPAAANSEPGRRPAPISTPFFARDQPIGQSTALSLAVARTNITKPKTFEEIAKEIDLAKAFESFYNTDASEYPDLINEIESGELDLITLSEDGNNLLHSEASGGHVEFFKLILLLPNANAQALQNINNYSNNNTTVLSKAIHCDHFDLALLLIDKFGADVNILVGDWINQTNDSRVSILRHAFSLFFKQSYEDYSEQQKKTFEHLLKKLLSKGLKFFETPDSLRPPSFRMSLRRYEIEKRHEIYMKKHQLTEKQFFIIEHMLVLEEKSPVIFKLFCHEAEAVKLTHPDAQDILQTWNWYNLNGRPQVERPSQSTPKFN